jgi:predicted RNA methylase
MKGSSYRQLRGALFVHKWLNPVAEAVSKNGFPSSRLYGSEKIFQGIVHRELDRLGIDRPFYPVRSAATYSYLYLLIRICTSLPVRRVLELGCGQSTLLLEALCGDRALDVTSLEHDPEWASMIGGQCEKVVLKQVPLDEREVFDRSAEVYDFDPDGVPFDLLLVDGPKGRRRDSRRGALAFVEGSLADEFLIVFDDAERRGELDTIGETLRLLDERQVDYSTSLVRSVNSQFVIATSAFRSAAFF